MSSVQLTVRHADGRTDEEEVQVQRVANCGMAARDPSPEAVDEAFEELATIGVDRPNSLPMIAPKPPHLMTTDTEIIVNSTTTGGESEFVLLPTSDRTFVGVGVDHKDDWLTDHNLHRANSSCPSVLANEVWLLKDVRDHWDVLELRCWTGTGSERELYQRTTLDAFLRPDELLSRVESKTSDPLVGTAVWSGTVATGENGDVDPRPEVSYGDYYAVQLYDPVLNRRLFCQYDVRLNDWVDDCDLP